MGNMSILMGVNFVPLESSRRQWPHPYGPIWAHTGAYARICAHMGCDSLPYLHPPKMNPAEVIITNLILALQRALAKSIWKGWALEASQIEPIPNPSWH